MTESERNSFYRKMQESMRPMTEAEIAEMQARVAEGWCGNPEAMRGQAGMTNRIWAEDIRPRALEPKVAKLTLLRRLIGWWEGDK